jgi:hypothetical protein
MTSILILKKGGGGASEVKCLRTTELIQLTDGMRLSSTTRIGYL